MRLLFIIFYFLISINMAWASEEALNYIKGEKNTEGQVVEYSFLGKTLSETKLAQLRVKLAANKDAGNNKAVWRDQLSLDLHEFSLREELLYQQLKYLWNAHAKKDDIDSLIQKEIDFLAEYVCPIQDVSNLDKESTIELNTIVNFEELNKFLIEYRTLLDFLKGNFIAQEFHDKVLNNLFSYTYNWVYITNNYFKGEWYFFEKGQISLGSLLVAFMLFVTLGGIFLVLKFFLWLALKTKDANVKRLVHSIDKPLLTFVLLLGSWLVIKVISYPFEILWLNKVFFSLSFSLIFWFLWKLSNNYREIILVGSRVFSGGNEKRFNIDMVNYIIDMFQTIILVSVFVYSILMFFPDLFVKIAAVAGIVGVVVSFIAKDSLGDFMGGTKIVFNENLQTGDWIKIHSPGLGEVSGELVNIKRFRSGIRLFDNSMAYIPNSLLAQSTFVHMDKREKGRKVDIGEVYLSSSSDADNLKLFIDEMMDYLFDNVKVSKNLNVSGHTSIERGIKDTLMGHVTKFTNRGIKVDFYCFSESIAWKDNRDLSQEIIFRILELSQKHNLEITSDYEKKIKI